MQSHMPTRLLLCAGIGLTVLCAGCRSKPGVLLNRDAYPSPATETALNTAYPAGSDAPTDLVPATPTNAPVPRPTLRTTPWPTLTPLPTVDGATPIEFRLVDHFGGDVGGVAVAGGFAYLVVGGRIEVIDAKDPTQPVRVGRTAPLSHSPARSGDVVVAGGIVSVSTGDGVLLVDALDPEAPVEIGWVPLEGSVQRIVGNDGILAALVTLDGMGPYGIQVIDLSNPTNPRLGGFVELVGRTSAIWLEDRMLWTYTSATWVGAIPDALQQAAVDSRTGVVDLTTSGLRRIDVSDPTHPREIAIDDLKLAYVDDEVPALAVADDKLYIVERVITADWRQRLAGDYGQRYDSLRVIGVHPDRPEIDNLGQWKGIGNSVTEQWSADLADDRLIVSNPRGFTGGKMIHAYDVADPQTPRPLADLNASLAQLECRLTAAPVWSDNHLWLPCTDRLRILDASDADMWREIGTYIPEPHPTIRDDSSSWGLRPKAVFVGNILWTVEDGPRVNDKRSPSTLRAWNIPPSEDPVALGFRQAAWEVDALATDGAYVYAIGNEWGDVSVLDVRDPSHPIEVATMERSTARRAHCAESPGSYCGPQGVTGAVVALGKLLIGYRLGGVEGGVVGGLEVVDVQDPVHPLEEGWAGGSVLDLVAGGDAAWAIPVGPSGSLMSVDFRRLGLGEPAAQYVDGLPESEGSCVAASGDRAHYAQTLDVTDDTGATAGDDRPTLTFRVLDHQEDGTVRVTGAITLSQRSPRFNTDAECTMVADRDLALLHVDSGKWDDPDQLYAIDVSDPAHPVIRGAYRGAHWPQPFAIRDRTLFDLSARGLARWTIDR